MTYSSESGRGGAVADSMAAAITDAGITAVVDTMVAVAIMAAVADADLPVGMDSLDAAAAEIFAVTSAVDSGGVMGWAGVIVAGGAGVAQRRPGWAGCGGHGC